MGLLSIEHVKGHHDTDQIVTQGPRIGHLAGIYRGHDIAQRPCCPGYRVYPPPDGESPLVTRHPPTVGPQTLTAICPPSWLMGQGISACLEPLEPEDPPMRLNVVAMIHHGRRKYRRWRTTPGP